MISEQIQKQKLLEEYEGKMGELLQSLHSVERAFVAQKSQYEDELQKQARSAEESGKVELNKLEAKVTLLVTKLEAAEAASEQQKSDARQKAWEAGEELIGKTKELEKVAKERDELSATRESAISEVNEKLFHRDTEVAKLRDELETLNKSAALRSEELTKFKAQVVSAQRASSSLGWEDGGANGNFDAVSISGSTVHVHGQNTSLPQPFSGVCTEEYFISTDVSRSHTSRRILYFQKKF